MKAGVVGLAPAGEAKRLRAGPPPITSRGSREPSQLRFRSRECLLSSKFLRLLCCDCSAVIDCFQWSLFLIAVIDCCD